MIVPDALKQNNIDSIVSDESMLTKTGEHKFGYAIVQNGKLVKAVKRTIPNGKWDECWLGCTIPGLFSLKPGCQGILGDESISELEKKGEEIPDTIADQAFKMDIDFEKTRDRFVKKAQKEYDKIAGLFEGAIPQLRYLWNDPIFKNMGIDEKRKFYHDQKAMRRVDKARKLHPAVLNLFFNIENYQGIKDDYIKRYRELAFTTFAVLKDDKWYERESGHLFESTKDNKYLERWSKECNDLIDSASEDVLLSVYICHR